ncbi:glycosyltransferase family 2 protein [Siphonobacter aquaeclarae]|jgi:glycosyltransferase involved in cell wall biosynthesis|uniref:Glycosyltransferase involved in cell wall bisynthesis n=1 Tax=Siphonobacter aquaeclarae TaxID=563176 RepID=A0A1G9K887_9BACT|nr:glycosyltransferase family 2 protein [Siphonobacter aquaeclarae]SDL45951.1 Glycosyltransferase involved in cell wall bisynthesis [Siphonobacter aquaeclarae]
MRVSVAMCTYNGGKFLPEQLESIRQQTRPVDELVVCDDRSSDDTVGILRDFAQTVAFPVHIHVNPANLGSTKNFEKCLSLCTGDILFCCDQDDKWHTEKVARQLAYLEQHPDKDAVFTDARVIDDASVPQDRTIWQEIEFDTAAQARWNHSEAHEILFGGFVVTGATLALRREVLARTTPFPTHIRYYIHDAWIALLLSLEEKIGFLTDELLFYRKHQTQQVGFGEKKAKVTLGDRFSRDREGKLKPLREKAEICAQLLAALRDSYAGPKLRELEQRQKHFQARATLPAFRPARIPVIWREWISGRYRFSSKDWWLPLAGDLFE